MNYRNQDAIGPDYKCSVCGLIGHRLWRQTHTFTDYINLLCAVCGEKSEVESIAKYAHFHDPASPTIGDLVPARPTPEGDTFWGHTSGDVLWWYCLPQYVDDAREMVQLKIERDKFCGQANGYAEQWMKSLDEKRAIIDAGANDAATIARLRAALNLVDDLALINNGDSLLKIRTVVKEALRETT